MRQSRGDISETGETRDGEDERLGLIRQSRGDGFVGVHVGEEEGRGGGLALGWVTVAQGRVTEGEGG